MRTPCSTSIRRCRLNKSFTQHVPKNHRHSILTNVAIGYFNPVTAERTFIEAVALIDTGASRSAVSKRFAERHGMVSYKMATVVSAHGGRKVPSYTTDIVLPGGIVFEGRKVTQFFGEHDFDVIIGLDILLCGDMAITNANCETVFSFRTPPADTHTDYTLQV